MMYLVFLALLYKLHGGSIHSFLKKTIFGLDTEEDKTPTITRNQTKAEGGGGGGGGGRYASDGGASDRSLLSTGGDSAGLEASQKPLAPFSTKTTRGGTFSGSYQQIPEEEEAERRSFSVASGVSPIVTQESSEYFSVNSHVGFKSSFDSRSIPTNSDGTGPGMTSISVNTDGPFGTTSSEVGTGSIGPFASKVGVATGMQSWYLSMKDRQTLKRRTISARLSPLAVLSSFVSDVDLVADWCFWHFGLAKQPQFIRHLALFFAIVGSIMWALATTEFGLASKLRLMCRGNLLGRLQHVGLGWQLLINVFLEDIPQFLITVYTIPTSVTGVFNLTTSALSLLAKTLQGLSAKHAPSLSTQFKMVDQDPVVTQNLFKLRDEAKKKAATAEKIVYLAWKARCSDGEKKAAAVFEILQIDPTFVNGDLQYMRADLFSSAGMIITYSSLTGPIPRSIGGMSMLRSVVLKGNQLTGAIPAEFGNLRSLEELDLSDNNLAGPIPAELGALTVLQVLVLSVNGLSGVIPAELGALNMLKSIILSDNELTGEIPTELNELDDLEEMDLSHNKLTGLIPTGFGNLKKLCRLSLGSNMLSGVEDTESMLKAHLHPDCNIELSPQREEERVEETA